MEVESENISENITQSLLMDHMNSGLPTNHSMLPPVCSLCQMTPSTDNFSYVNGGTVGVCGHCKFLLLEDLDTSTDDLRRRRLHRGRRSITGSSESIEDFFSQEFSQMMNLARQNQLLVSELYDPPDNSRRWRRMSDTESDGFDHLDSFYAETESNSSFGARILQGDSLYGGDSDASVEDHSFLETEPFPQSTERVDFESDSDIDPMHTGLVNWDSDGSEENATGRTRLLGLEQIIHMRIRETDYSPLYNFSSRRGPPPAAESFINTLPRIIINPNQKTLNDVTCSICKDPMPNGIEAIQLPCLHLYHPSCILPWLNRRNTCPLCRHELPTNDTGYANPSSQQNESSSDEDVYEPDTEIIEPSAENRQEIVNLRNGDRGRWCFLVAAPVVSILGLVCVLWLGKPLKNQRINTENNQRQNRRWWNWF